MNKNFKKRMAQDSELEHMKGLAKKRRAKSEKGINIYSYVLSAICAVLAVLFFIYGSPLLGIIFLSVGALLSLVVWLSVKVERKEQEEKENLNK